MIRVYFVFEDPLDDTGINLSYVDVPVKAPREALERVEQAAESGALWRNLYPDDEDYPYTLITGKMMHVEIAATREGSGAAVLLSS